MEWIVYTESLGARSEKIPAGWGAVVISPTQEEQFDQGPLGWTENSEQRSALVAAIKGLLLVPEGETAELVSGSQYVINGLTSQEYGSGDMGKAHKHDENVALWKRLSSTMDSRNVHVCTLGNDWETEHKERARAYAVEASNAAANGRRPASSIIRRLDGKTVDAQSASEHLGTATGNTILGDILGALFGGRYR